MVWHLIPLVQQLPLRPLPTRPRWHHSGSLSLSHGVPQGSIIGPILFLIFVNDLACFLPHGRLVSYADDTQILDSAPSNPSDLQALKSRAEENIQCLQHWFSLNSLKMNAGKTSFIILGTRKSIERTSNFVLRINDVDIRPSKHIKVLGVLLDQTLSWDAHISSVVRRTNAILVSLFKIRHHLSPEILKILVQAHVFPHLQYCSSVWGGATKSRLDRLRRSYISRHGWYPASAGMITLALPLPRSAGPV